MLADGLVGGKCDVCDVRGVTSLITRGWRRAREASGCSIPQWAAGLGHIAGRSAMRYRQGLLTCTVWSITPTRDQQRPSGILFECSREESFLYVRFYGGRYWDRTSDPCRVKAVLYR